MRVRAPFAFASEELHACKPSLQATPQRSWPAWLRSREFCFPAAVGDVGIVVIAGGGDVLVVVVGVLVVVEGVINADLIGGGVSNNTSVSLVLWLVVLRLVGVLFENHPCEVSQS